MDGYVKSFGENKCMSFLITDKQLSKNNMKWEKVSSITDKTIHHEQNLNIRIKYYDGNCKANFIL